MRTLTPRRSPRDVLGGHGKINRAPHIIQKRKSVWFNWQSVALTLPGRAAVNHVLINIMITAMGHNLGRNLSAKNEIFSGK